MALKIAALVPVYNSAEYLAQCLDSILAQTYPGVEVFCHDDGSSDGALEILRRYERDYPRRIHVKAWENHGAVPTINRLLDDLPESFDAYVMVDCDDYVHPKMVEVLAEEMEHTGADVVECGAVHVSADAVCPQGLPEVGDYGRSVISDMSVFQLRKTAPGAWILRWNKLYRRSAVAGIRMRPGLEYEGDFFFGYEVNAAIRKKVLVDIGLYAYRWNPRSATSKVNYTKYVRSALERIRLSCELFLNCGRIPQDKEMDFRKELSKDAFRMCIRKNLKNNDDSSLREKLFLESGKALRKLASESRFDPVGLNPVQRLAWLACIRGWYRVAQAIVFLT